MEKSISHQSLTINHLYIFCDGGSRGNPGPAGAGFLVKDSLGKILIRQGKFLGTTTNNVAEYQAVIQALVWLYKHQSAVAHQLSTIIFYLDSLLIVNQLNGLYKIKNANLKTLIIKVKSLENQIKGNIYYHHIGREKNKEADKIVNQVLDKALQNKVR